MKELLLLSFMFSAMNIFAQQKFQLAQPLVKYNSVFFADKTSFEVLFNQPGAEIRYTLNGNEPTDADLLYKKPVTINKKSIVKIKAIGKDFLPSETITMEFIKEGKKIEQVEFSGPNEHYAKAAKNILNDDIGGLPNFGGGTWLGYNGDSAVITITLLKKGKVRSVLANMLVDEGSWIFLPSSINIYAVDRKTNSFQLVGNAVFNHDKSSEKKCIPYEIVLDKDLKTTQLQLVFSTLQKIPDRHAGKGNHAWFFIDEIKVY